MTPSPANPPPQPLDYPPASGKPPAPRTWRLVVGIILMAVGLPVAAYYAIGSLFVAGAVQQHDPSVTRADVVLCLVWVTAGVAMFVTGTALVARRRARAGP